ncbi:TetR/AcrR family transcriptional regulator [Vibrio rumoiensis]|uniref:TetR family transcriptional regulator n=1 Tax=Vibrio rumoiensis 1S-45 TaxID=1188252 RepID=A0A1E5E6J3_9VIBR|nr:TetR/AcrR family transcriptional regulator [Vibrio rumoiensis]OEF30141.1 TetR family transcriptional regulator [Vibrio rumoiensis 1S-45]
MGRKSNFDREEKLILAMHLFWQKGYVNTSISELVEHLGINRFSIYNTFGDKQGLYYASLQHYFTHVSQPASQVLFGDNADIETLCEFLTRFVDIQKKQEFGCFIQNALLEHANRDKEVIAKGNDLFTHLQKGIQNCLTHALNKQQLNSDTDLTCLTDLILVQIQGIRVLGKAKQYQRLDNSLRQLIMLLKKP